jgi:hypothetical protein
VIIFLAKNVINSVFLLVPAKDFDEAKEKLEKWKPGVYEWAGETVEFSEATQKPIAMIEIDFKVRLQEKLGLQTSQV